MTKPTWSESGSFGGTDGSPDERERDVEAAHEVLYGPDGQTIKAERWVRRAHVERDPRVGFWRACASLVGGMFAQLVTSAVLLLLTAAVAQEAPGWMVGLFACGSLVALLGAPVLLRHDAAETFKVVGFVALVVLGSVAIMYLGALWFGLPGVVGSGVLVVSALLLIT